MISKHLKPLMEAKYIPQSREAANASKYQDHKLKLYERQFGITTTK